MRTFAFCLTLLVFPLSANAQLTFADLLSVNETLQGTTEQVPDSYRKVHDFLLSKGMILRSYSLGLPSIQIGIPRPPQPPNLKEVTLQYSHSSNGNAEIVSITVTQRVDSTSKPYIEYNTQLTTSAFQQYVQWRTDAQTALKSIPYSYIPFVDTFTIPSKNGTSKIVQISSAFSDQYGRRSVVTPFSFGMNINRITY